ncbi:M35 family metallopeptidase [Falsiroseomonas sp. CW058]|uniref:M35 family metallopeptidase n=1 Tax=Falsiroseomonas sp. CW058 TaxID=3388664 RepID=UPI003D313F50
MAQAIRTRPALPRIAPLALAALVLAGFPALGREMAPKPPPAEPSAARIPGPVCVAEHRRAFQVALGEAQARMRDALRLARDEPGHPHLRRWFGSTPPATVRRALERTAAQLERAEELKILCNVPSDCRGTTLAYTRPGAAILGLCPRFFEAGHDGVDSRWGILIHEASHLAAGTDDHAYGREAALVLAKRDPKRAAANADNYEYFVETLPR